MAKVLNKKPVFCSCCNDEIEYDHDHPAISLIKEPLLGVVCHGCKSNLRVAVHLLKHFGMGSCEDGADERGQYL
jgi:hypothetical protein